MESTCQAPQPKHGRQILPLDLICIVTWKRAENKT
jgi:hypothetical protein